MQAFAANIGGRLTPWTLQDQHDQPYTLDTQTRVLLVARNMDGSKLVKAALENEAKGYLEARNVVFLADVQRMPSLIGKFIETTDAKALDTKCLETVAPVPPFTSFNGWEP